MLPCEADYCDFVYCSVELWCCPMGDLFTGNEAIQGNLLSMFISDLTSITLGSTQCQHANLFKKW